MEYCCMERVVTVSVGSMVVSGTQAFKGFAEQLHLLARQRNQKVIIDFKECFYIDSHAIALIISANRRLKLSGTQLVIQNANTEISDLLRTIQINRIIEIVE